MKHANINVEKRIRNINIPSCKNCIYYIPITFNNLDKCNKFGTKDIINDKISYEYANSCRYNESKCGIQGKYFQQQKYVKLKILKHKIINIMPITLIFFIPTSVLYFIAKIKF